MEIYDIDKKGEIRSLQILRRKGRTTKKDENREWQALKALLFSREEKSLLKIISNIKKIKL